MLYIVTSLKKTFYYPCYTTDKSEQQKKNSAMQNSLERLPEYSRSQKHIGRTWKEIKIADGPSQVGVQANLEGCSKTRPPPSGSFVAVQILYQYSGVAPTFNQIRKPDNPELEWSMFFLQAGYNEHSRFVSTDATLPTNQDKASNWEHQVFEVSIGSFSSMSDRE